jgi:mpaB/rubber oxygenase-like protein
MTGKWTNELLEDMRNNTDPLADKVVAAVIDTGVQNALNALFRELVNNRDVIPASLPKEARDFFETTQHLPEWADQKKIKQGEDVFILHGPEMVPMLLLSSLPNAYSMAKGAHVLAITAQLTGHVHRRIFRTAQFVADVMQPGGLNPDGRGIRSAQKVRLIHATIRHYIKHHPDRPREWDHKWGEPINQEDLASTLLDFSVGVMKGVGKTGIRLTSEQAEAYHHCWRVVGHIMGVDPKLQAENVQEAYELSKMISTRQAGESEAGEALTRDLIEFMQGAMPRLFKGLPASAIRFFSGDEVANIIKTGPYNWTLVVLYLQIFLLRNLNTFRRNHPGSQKYIRFLTWNLMDKIVLHEEGRAFYFELPEELRAVWRLPAHTGKTPST